MNSKFDKVREQAEEAQAEQRRISQMAVVEEKERLLKEAKDAAEVAAAQDGGGVSVSDPGPEAVRTQKLVEQYERELREAKDELEQLGGGRESDLNLPDDPRTVRAGSQGMRAKTTTRTV